MVHYPAWKRYYYSSKGYYTKLRFSAKKRNNHFSLGRDEFIAWFESQRLNCFYCGRLLSRNGGYSNDNITIDRRDNSIGYQIDNIVMSCRRCNTIKGNTFTADEMREIANKYIKPKLLRGEL